MKSGTLEARSRAESTAASDVVGSRDNIGLLAAIINLGILIELFSMDAPALIVAPFLLFSLAGLSVPVALRYVREGRLVATPALILYALMMLYTAPVIVTDMLFDYAAFRPLAHSALILVVALNGVVIALLACDRPGPSPEAARWIERHQWPFCLAAYGLLGVAAVWLAFVFGSLAELNQYLFETNYYGKHIYFEGKGYQGLFVVCFELAGVLSTLALAVPRAARTCPWPLTAGAMALVALATINQGYRTTIVLVACQYLVARSLWTGTGVRVVTLGIVAGVLAPAFLMWAFIRHNISSGDIFDLEGIRALLASANWMNIHESEIGVTLINGGHLLSLLESGEWHYRWGETLVLDPLMALIPRAFWAERPDSLQIAFTRVVDPTYAEGGTMSFSFSLEGFLNFGIIGAAAWSGLLACFLIELRRWVERAAGRNALVTCLAMTVLYAQVWFYIRDDFGDLVRRAAIAMCIALGTGWSVRAVVELFRSPVAPVAAESRRSLPTTTQSPV
jgi:hypothetical protein